MKQQMSRRDASKSLMTLALGLSLSSFEITSLVENLRKKPIPSSGEQLPVVGVGTWQTFDVGNNDSEREPLRQVLKLLTEKGGSVIDSSPMYGRSEGVVGELSKELDLSKKLFGATKVWTSGKQSGIRQMEQSMQLMNKRPMDLMQVHNLVDWRTHLDTLKGWKADGKVRYMGITHYVESAYDDMEQIMKNHPIDFIQLNYSILSRTAEQSILPLAQDRGIAVIVNRPYEGGSLFRKTRGKEIPTWAKDFDCNSWGQFFLKYMVSHPAVNCVIPGTAKPKHMIDNLGAGLGRLPNAEQRKRMVKLVENL
ncbi:MAG: aldo/keto reductase [Bacteroidota bacterium]